MIEILRNPCSYEAPTPKRSRQAMALFTGQSEMPSPLHSYALSLAFGMLGIHDKDDFRKCSHFTAKESNVFQSSKIIANIAMCQHVAPRYWEHLGFQRTLSSWRSAAEHGPLPGQPRIGSNRYRWVFYRYFYTSTAARNGIAALTSWFYLEFWILKIVL